ncbi:hypothetical protein [Clavibacter phaseoli]|nr:hypothetical protein [Clavibacter phaseoli]
MSMWNRIFGWIRWVVGKSFGTIVIYGIVETVKQTGIIQALVDLL